MRTTCPPGERHKKEGPGTRLYNPRQQEDHHLHWDDKLDNKVPPPAQLVFRDDVDHLPEWECFEFCTEEGWKKPQ